ncbi:OST-HTH/LOTUS domain-containing protein [Iodobacter fluviatilis]|nr:OST-HTH/LOTUS domain-containing protein [Iodobacter fluviatilis]
MLMLQYYERGLKALLAYSNFEVVQTDNGFRHNLDDNKESVRNKTLGQLVKQYTGGKMLLPKAEGEEKVPESDAEDEPDDGKIRMRFNSSVEVSSEEYERIKAQLSEMVEMRNGLVHHFIERFDLYNEASLTSAADYLDDCYTQVSAQHEALKVRLIALDKSRKILAELFNSTEYKDWFFRGLDPSGGREHMWEQTPVVKALFEAEQKLAAEGWTKLNDAINYIRKHYPEDFPKRYRYKHWDQLIKATNLFDLGERKWPDNQTIVFYRTHQQEIALTESIE